MQLVVPSAVRKAVRAATITFTATSTIRFVFITINYPLGFAAWLAKNYQLSTINYPLSIIN